MKESDAYRFNPLWYLDKCHLQIIRHTCSAGIFSAKTDLRSALVDKHRNPATLKGARASVPGAALMRIEASD